MIINEDYFKDLEITDEDIIDDDINDVEEPKHELTVKELHKLPEQYDYCIRIKIVKKSARAATFIQTSLIPRITKRLDAIFESYGIEHSEYILTSSYYAEGCDTIVEFGDYQLFCEKYKKDEFINNTYSYFYVNVYVNYPEFTYKRAFHFLYSVLNIFRLGEQINMITFNLLDSTEDINLFFFYDYESMTVKMNFIGYDEQEYRRLFYKYTMQHFFGKAVEIDYNALKRDVPLKPIILKYD